MPHGISLHQSLDQIMKNKEDKGVALDGSHDSPFERIKRTNEDGDESWSARDLAKILDYSEYRHFLPVIKKAQKACLKSGQSIDYHFEEVLDMIKTGKGAERPVKSWNLSRYACYLIIQNADPTKEIVALGQTYFAYQTRKQEISEQLIEEKKRLLLREEMRTHNTRLADAARDAGVIEPIDYAIFQDHGYKGLYGGLGAKEIHKKKALKKSHKILDHMGSTELAANLFRATQTEEKLRRENISGKHEANRTHHEVGAKVRKTIKELGGTMPEDLPTHEHISKIEQKHRKAIEDKKEE